MNYKKALRYASKTISKSISAFKNLNEYEEKKKANFTK
jgi:hypothetical protein